MPTKVIRIGIMIHNPYELTGSLYMSNKNPIPIIAITAPAYKPSTSIFNLSKQPFNVNAANTNANDPKVKIMPPRINPKLASLMPNTKRKTPASNAMATNNALTIKANGKIDLPSFSPFLFKNLFLIRKIPISQNGIENISRL